MPGSPLTPPPAVQVDSGSLGLFAYTLHIISIILWYLSSSPSGEGAGWIWGVGRQDRGLRVLGGGLELQSQTQLLADAHPGNRSEVKP